MQTEQETMGLFERVIRLDERTKTAQERLDTHERLFAEISERIKDVEKGVAKTNLIVAKLNTKVALGAAIGSLLGGGVIAFALSFLGG